MATTNHPTVEFAKTYLDARLGERARKPAGARTNEGPFVTISRESGAGGTTLARMLATRLNRDRPGELSWTVFDQEIVELMLRDQNLPASLARYFPEDKVSEVDALVREIIGLHPSLWTLLQKTNLVICELATRGGSIIVGRGGRFATDSVKHGLHIRLVAPEDHRARVMAEALKVTQAKAAAHNRKVDAARRDYVRSVFEADVASPTEYDIVLNTGSLSLPFIADIIEPVALARMDEARKATH